MPTPSRRRRAGFVIPGARGLAVPVIAACGATVDAADKAMKESDTFKTARERLAPPARPADEVAVRQRPSDYAKRDDPQAAFGADTSLLFLGFNESFAGPDGVEKFKAADAKYPDELAAKHPRDDTRAPSRVVIVPPIAVEDSGARSLPGAAERNAVLARYHDAARDAATPWGLACADIDERTPLRQSSMREGLAATLSPNEFLDVIEFLKSLE